MLKAIQIGFNDLAVSANEKGFWFNLVVLPLVFILIVGYISGGQSTSNSPIRLDVIDYDQSEQSAQLGVLLRDFNERLRLCPTDADCGLDDEGATLDEESSLARVKNGEAHGLLVIPAGYGESVLTGESVDLSYRSNVDSLEPDYLVTVIQSVIGQISGASVAGQVSMLVYPEGGEAFRQAVYDRASETWRAQGDVVQYHQTLQTDDSAQNMGMGFRQSVPGIGSMYVMFTVLTGAVMLIQNRKYGILQRLAVQPVSKAQIIGGKMLAKFMMGMIQYGVAFFVGIFFGVTTLGNIIPLLVVMIAFTACMSAIAFLLATWVDNDQQASGIMLFASLTMAPLGGAWWPLEIVPSFMQVIGMLTPVGWAMKGFQEILFYGGGVMDVLLPVGVLLGASVVIFGLAVSRFKYQ
jgi:ABC-2 type transport system permease protein